jgi:hypothetical protein
MGFELVHCVSTLNSQCFSHITFYAVKQHTRKTDVIFYIFCVNEKWCWKMKKKLIERYLNYSELGIEKSISNEN